MALNYTLLAMVLSGVGASVWMLSELLLPRHYFTLWTVAGGEIRLRIKNLAGLFHTKDPGDGKGITFVMDPAFGRAGKRGMRYTGDAATGLLLRWDHTTRSWQEQDPKYVFAALEDGREGKLVTSTDPGLSKYAGLFVILGGMALVALAIIGYFVYKVYGAVGAGG